MQTIRQRRAILRRDPRVSTFDMSEYPFVKEDT